MQNDDKDNSDRIRMILAVASVAGITFMITGLFVIKVPDENKELINTVFMFVLGCFGLAFSFYFGSSEGSKRKTHMLNQRYNEQATGKADDPIHVEPTESTTPPPQGGFFMPEKEGE